MNPALVSRHICPCSRTFSHCSCLGRPLPLLGWVSASFGRGCSRSPAKHFEGRRPMKGWWFARKGNTSLKTFLKNLPSRAQGVNELQREGGVRLCFPTQLLHFNGSFKWIFSAGGICWLYCNSIPAPVKAPGSFIWEGSKRALQ